MCVPESKLGLPFLAGMATLGLLALIWAMTIGSSEARQGAMQNCPQAGRWAISVWSGDDGTDANQALATCGEGAVAAAYHIDPQAGSWSRWFADQPGLSTLSMLDNMQGVMALGGAEAPASPTPTPSPIPPPSPTPTSTPTPTPTPTPAPTPTLAPISLTFTSTRPPGSFTGTPFPTAKVYFFIVSGFDLDAVRPQLSVGLSGPSGSVPDDFHLWQWVQGAPSAIALFLFPVLPAGEYTVSIRLPDGRTATAAFTHVPG